MCFEFSYPVYAVIDKSALPTQAMLITRDSDGVLGIGLFTEELHAERAIELSGFKGKLQPIRNYFQLVAFLRTRANPGEIDYAAIDCVEDGKTRTAWEPISNIYV